jgi:hypothetical protein
MELRGKVLHCRTLADAMTIKLAEDAVARRAVHDLTYQERSRICHVLANYACYELLDDFQAADPWRRSGAVLPNRP